MKKAWLGIAISLFLEGGLFAATPSGIAFDWVSSNTVSLSWTLAAPGADTPIMVLSADDSFTAIVSSEIGALGTQTTNYHSLTANVTYYFKVKEASDGPLSYSVPVASAIPPVLPQSVALSGVWISSFSVDWGGGNNSASTRYFAETAIDEAFTLNTAFSSGTALSASFTGLNPNTTWQLRLKTFSFVGQDSDYINSLLKNPCFVL